MYRNSKFTNYYKRPFYLRKSTYFLLALLIALVSFVVWSIKKAPNEEAQNIPLAVEKAPTLDGKISFLTGSTQIKSGEAEWTDLKSDTQIKAGDSVRTQAAGRVIIELPDKSYVRLFENSELKFTTLGMTDIVIENVSGTSYHRVNDQSTAIYRLKQNNIELTALGTAFNVSKEDNLLKATVIESRLKVKIYDGEEITNMRTIESGTRCTVNTGLALAQMIQSEDVQASTLLENEWYSWNLEKDKETNFFLGIFEKATKLTLTEPTQTEFETDKDKITIKGSTEKDAEIIIAGKDVKNNDGNFETIVPLTAGDNQIEILVKKDKNINKRTLKIKSTQKDKSITLSVEREGPTSVKLSWILTNVNEFKEFKALLSTKEESPVLGATNKTFAKDKLTETWNDIDDGKYNFRICALAEDNSCIYSNVVSLLVGEAAVWENLEMNLIAHLIEPNNINLTWTNNRNLDNNVSLKLIESNSKTPVYPGRANHSLSGGTNSDTWENVSNGTHYFRLCLYENNQCLKYSNTASLTVSSKEPSISLSGTSSAGAVQLKWTNNNVVADSGYQAIRSESSRVSFPGSDYHSVSTTNDTFNNLAVGQTYYFRVCQNLAGECGVYSNEISVTVK